MLNFRKKRKKVNKKRPVYRDEVGGLFIDPARKILSLRKRVPIIRIDWHAFRNHPHTRFISIAAMLIAILGGSFFSFRSRATIATFYPGDCLGSWKYADRAEGTPQEPSKNSEIASYSAILANSTGDIYCGNFGGDIPNEKVPEKFSLNLSLYAFPEGKIRDTGPTRVEKESSSEDQQSIEDALAPSVDDILEGGGSINEIPEKKEEVVETETIEETPVAPEEPVVEETPTPEPEPVIEEEPTPEPVPEETVSFWKRITRVVKAQEEIPAPEPTPEPEPVVEETTLPEEVAEEPTPEVIELPDTATTTEEVIETTDTTEEEIVEEDVYVPETVQIESPLNYLFAGEEDVVFLEDIEQPEDISVVIFDPYGDVVDLSYSFKKVLYEGIEKTQIVVDKNQRDFKPGRYTIEVSVDTPQAKVTTQKDFSWGVLAVNFDRSVYYPGMTSYIQMGVLDDGGRTVCDADLTMYVTDPDGNISTLSTDNGTITREEECGPDNIISVPDYYAYFDTTIEGEYKTTLSAITANGQKTVKDSFMVDEGVVFDVERIAPTRINPKAEYSVTLKVTATEDWSGTVIERVPLSFDIRKGSQGIPYNNIIENLGEKEIRWSLSLTAGETATISYRFKAPLISPELFLIGPLSFRFGEEVFFEEGRYWQIASDAVANNGVMYYGDTNASSQGVLRARVFT
ncbi:hypothetical protein KC842_01795, partial [Candidatus Nomurabacteria bacterium]|nr:hypothetical protein [Candidatus Nomurabacteria bacterium]